MSGPAIISREDARARGLKRYFTGVPCNNGHVTERNVKKGACFMCEAEYRLKNKGRQSEWQKQHYVANKENILMKQGRHYEANKEKILERGRRYRELNKESILERGRKYHQQNKERINARKKLYREASKERISARGRRHYKANKLRILERLKLYRSANKEMRKLYYKTNKSRIIEKIKQYYEVNREAISERRRPFRAIYKKNNRHLTNAHGAKRRATKLRATPPWADLDAIKAIYLEAAQQSKHVDHIIPLQGREVCGLHVGNNLQLLDPIANIAKSNRFDPSEHEWSIG